jgi:hypothetical protein
MKKMFVLIGLLSLLGLSLTACSQGGGGEETPPANNTAAANS